MSDRIYYSCHLFERIIVWQCHQNGLVTIVHTKENVIGVMKLEKQHTYGHYSVHQPVLLWFCSLSINYPLYYIWVVVVAFPRDSYFQLTRFSLWAQFWFITFIVDLYFCKCVKNTAWDRSTEALAEADSRVTSLGLGSWS